MDVITCPKYPVTLLKLLYRLQQDDVLCDVHLSSDEGFVHAHRNVLMAASPFFSKKLACHLSTDKDIIKFDKVPLSLLKNVVCFMYTGALTVSQHDVNQILDICTDLGLHDAVKACMEYKHARHSKETDVGCHNDVLENPDGEHMKTVDEDLDQDKADPHDKQDPEPISVPRKAKSTRKRLKNVSKAVTMAEEDENSVSKLKNKRGMAAVNASQKSNIVTRRAVSSKKGTDSKRGARAICKVDTNLEEKDNLIEKDVAKDKTDISVEKEKVPESDDIGGESTDKLAKLKDSSKDLPYEDDSDCITNFYTDYESESVEKLESKTAKDGKTTKRKSKLLRKVRVKVIDKGKKSKKQLSDNVRVRQRKRFPCTSCSRVLSSHKRLVFHEFSKHGAPYDKERYAMVPCKEKGCDYVAADRRSLDTHMKSRHGCDRPHVCEFCGKAFKLPNVLATHLNIHTNKKVWKCEECSETFNQQSGLDIHMKRHHIGESSWCELCHLCSEKFLQKSELAWHLFKAHDQPLPEKYKAFICDICGYKSRKTHDFQRHTNAHAGIKQFSCSVCQKSCSTKSELKRHMLFHGEKKFKCKFDGCTYACTDSIGLGKHTKLMHTHKGFKPFGCPVCPYRTGVKGNLDKHIRTVHNLEVVTKHTIHLKMKYTNFESGDIITKDGRLVATAQERKHLQECTPATDAASCEDDAPTRGKQLTSDSQSGVVEDAQAAQGLLREFLVQQEQARLQNLSSAASERVAMTEGQTQRVLSESMNNNVVPLSNFIYIPNGVSLVPQDLRVSLGNQSDETGNQAEMYTMDQGDVYSNH